MAEAAADKPLDPKALQAKYTYKDADKDQEAIDKVENAIKARFPESYAEGLKESGKEAPIDESEARDKIKEAEEKANKESHDHPDEVKKEAHDSPPGKLLTGAAIKPAVHAPSPTTGGPKEPKKGAPGAGAKKHEHGGAPGKAGAGAAPHPSRPLTLAALGGGDGNLDKFLDDYPHKSPETGEKLSKIKEMAAVAKGFDGQVEGYVKRGDGAMESAKAGMINFLGKKDLETAFGENPYAKVQGGLGTLMQWLSKFQAIASIVGNVCGKIGMILTVVGLFGMILPPLGAAVSAVARVLNVVGIICDAIGLALAGVLTGLNGVVLAKQIGKGASNEEKAATADMMVNEATSASGHIMSLAMSYGPGFMKGFKSASKGVVGQLFAKFKSVVGKFTAKALGPVAGWAKNVGFKLGFGLSKEPGLMSKVWKAPEILAEKVRNTSLIKKINSSGFMQSLERGSARINSNKFITGVTDLGENAGKLVGEREKDVFGWGAKLKTSAEKDIAQTAEFAEQQAARNAANREAATIDRNISREQKLGNTEYENSVGLNTGVADERAAARGAKAYERADALEAGKGEAVQDAEKEGAKEYKAKEKEKLGEEKHEEDRKEEWKRDPKRFQAETKGLETRRENIEEQLKDKNLSPEKREKLAHTSEKLEKTIDQRRQIGMKSAGGEAPENLWQGYKQGKEAWEQGHFKSETGEKLESYKKVVEKKSGHEDTEKFEKAERHEKVEEWTNEPGPAPRASEEVEGMLAGLDEDLGGDHEPGGHEPGGHEPSSSEPDEPASAEPAVAAEPGGHVHTAAEPAKPAAREGGEGKSGGEAKGEGGGESDLELVYWPKLTASGGEFAKAASDLGRMKQIAFAFHKSQIEAKKKAMETVATLSKSGDDAAKRQEGTQAHVGALHGTIDEATQAGASADHGGAQADEGTSQQNKGKGSSNGKAQESPSPGDKPGLLHPIKRIWWYVKRWASEKAAAVFGWIQEKIASLVLGALCGVSMGDMKNYTNALHNRMQYSKLVGTEGVDNANKAMAEQAKAKTESKSYADQAMDDARECDQNMADADNFVKTVEATEQDLAAEQAKATQFLTELRAAVETERKKQAEEKAKAAEAAKAQGPAAPDAVSGASPVASGKPSGKPDKSAAKAESKKAQTPSPTAVGKVTNAASYVVSQANLVVQQVTTQRNDQSERLKGSVEGKSKEVRNYIKGREVGVILVDVFKAQTSSVVGSMNAVRSQSPSNAQALKTMAQQVRTQAKQLDGFTTSTSQSLNLAFKDTYDQESKLDHHA
jgi:hypothetical protein